MSASSSPSGYEFSQGAAVVVGGSGGVGRSICDSLARQGCDVVVTYRLNKERANEVVAQLESLGRRAWAVALDVENEVQTQSLFESIPEQYGPIHTVVYAVGAAIDQPYISQVTSKQWSDVMQSDVNGFFHVVAAALPQLRKNQGSLIAITSAGLYRYPPGDILSVAPKGAIEALVRGLAREEGRFGVRANCVALGVIDAGMFLRLKDTVFDETWLSTAKQNTPLRRFGTAKEVADSVTFLASKQAGFITGQTMMLDGGYSI